MSQRQRTARYPREGDLEKRLRDDFKEYEAWRASQAEAGPGASSEEPSKPAKKKGPLITRWDLVLFAVGLLGALLFQTCTRGGQ